MYGVSILDQTTGQLLGHDHLCREHALEAVDSLVGVPGLIIVVHDSAQTDCAVHDVAQDGVPFYVRPYAPLVMA
jgi:hypothetical protein